MDEEHIQKWAERVGAMDHESFSRNNLDWVMYRLPDGWYALFLYQGGGYVAKLQAKTREAAVGYANLYELPRVAFRVIGNV